MQADSSASYNVSCFGAGFVGLPTSSVLANKNPEISFTIYDINKQRIKSCQEGKLPIFQPNLQETMALVKDKNLKLTSDMAQALTNVSVVFLALPTPTKSFGQNAGKAYDLSYTQIAIESIIEYYNQNPKNMAESVILVQKSTVPIGTAKMIGRKIANMSIPENKDKYIVTSNPEFLAEGSAINDLMKPDRVVLGVPEGSDVSKLRKLYDYAKERVILTNQSSSELSKLVANCFLAQRVSSINSIAILCEQYEADVKQVKKCIAADTRIGDKFLNSSVGFGGSCFKKDMLALIYLAESKGLHEVAQYWMAVISMNNYRKKSFFKRVFKELNSNLKGKKISIFGTAFKKDTCDARQSPALDVCHYFLVEGAVLQIYDPKTSRDTFIENMCYNQLWDTKFDKLLHQMQSPEQACQNSSAIVILTEWDEFKTYDYEKLSESMCKPYYVFDGRNILDESKMAESKLKYCRVGKKFLSHGY